MPPAATFKTWVQIIGCTPGCRTWLPTGLKRIRHYGLLASSCKAAKLAQARAALAMPASKALALESAAALLKRTAGIDAQQCPCCSAGRLRVVQMLAGPRQLPTASSTVLPQGRAPP